MANKRDDAKASMLDYENYMEHYTNKTANHLSSKKKL